MLFGRRKPGYTTTVDSSVDPEQAVLDLQKAELAAKKKPKAEVFDINAASETARRLKETGSSFDGSAAKTGEDVIAAVERRPQSLQQCRLPGPHPKPPKLCRTRPQSLSCWIFWPASRRLKTIPLRISPPRPRRSCRS